MSCVTGVWGEMTKHIQSLSVILPVINERDNLVDLIPEITAVLEARSVKYEIIVVDDGSTDGTKELLAELARTNSDVKHLVRTGMPQSLPKSIMDGVNLAKSCHVVWMDADGSMPPEVISTLMERFEDSSKPTVVVGSRFVPGGGFKGIEVVGETSWKQIYRNVRDSNDSLVAVVLSRILNKYLWLTLNRCCRDLATGFVLTERATVLTLSLHGSYGDYCVRFLYEVNQMGFAITEVPFVNQLRRHGDSKTGSSLWDYLRRGAPYVVLPIRLRICRKH